MKIPRIFITLFALFLVVQPAQALQFNNAQIPLEEIEDGGPSKDDIPSLTDPKTLPADQAKALNETDRILGVVLNGQARAYPLQILNWHEVVNDQLAGQSIAVTYGPLCGAGVVFDAQVNSNRLQFGVSGKLYNSDLLFFDRETESLWSQLDMRAVTGHYAGVPLKQIPAEVTTWARWKAQYPQTTVLSSNTGFEYDYAEDPYVEYRQTERLLFPVNHHDWRLPNKDWVIGVRVNGVGKAYAFDRLKSLSGVLEDQVGGQDIRILYDATAQAARVEDAQGQTLPSVVSYWFAWAAFHPETLLFEDSNT